MGVYFRVILELCKKKNYQVSSFCLKPEEAPVREVLYALALIADRQTHTTCIMIGDMAE